MFCVWVNLEPRRGEVNGYEESRQRLQQAVPTQTGSASMQCVAALVGHNRSGLEKGTGAVVPSSAAGVFGAGDGLFVGAADGFLGDSRSCASPYRSFTVLVVAGAGSNWKLIGGNAGLFHMLTFTTCMRLGSQ